jgi:outer membrane protein assembly factor BamE
MRIKSLKLSAVSFIILIFVFSSGCIIKPYHVDVQQGNILSQNDVNKIHPGMTKDEIMSILGEPMLRNSFDSNTWSYVYTNQINGGKIEQKCIVMHFAGSKLVKISAS